MMLQKSKHSFHLERVFFVRRWVAQLCLTVNRRRTRVEQVAALAQQSQNRYVRGSRSQIQQFPFAYACG